MKKIKRKNFDTLYEKIQVNYLFVGLTGKKSLKLQREIKMKKK